ncbi:MAG: hypothetical protein U5K54_08040 [Cytophagales bacterium]|nr:hypothetical protein [Cytophagales bacterium]
MPAETSGFSTDGGFASNGYGEHSPGGYSLMAALVTESSDDFLFPDYYFRINKRKGTGPIRPNRYWARDQA